jgi:MFS family permease
MKIAPSLKRLYVIGFLFSLHTALILYSNSSFLNQYIPESYLGLLYSIGALLAIVGLLLVPKLIAKFGSKITMASIGTITLAICLANAFVHNPVVLLVLFCILFAVNIMFFLSNDIVIDQVADTDHMGNIRGTYLTSLNLGYILAPSITGFILSRMGFSALYIIAGLIIIPLILFILIVPSMRQVHPSKTNIWKSLQTLWKSHDVRNIIGANFILQFFYSWMVLYTPIFLHRELDIPWDSVGSIFSIMLLAFVLTQIPLGKLADRFLGEKGLLIFGFIMMGGSTLLLFALPYFTLPLLALILFGTRIGASCIEVLTESYFFKKVPKSETGSISIFRNTYPIAYIIAPILGSIVLSLLSTKYLFLILGIICLSGILFIIPIKNTK